MRCGNCKHWTGDEERDDYRQDIGLKVKLCVVPKILNHCFEFSMEETEKLEKDPDTSFLTAYVLKPEFKDLKMFVQDASNYRANLYTREDFFCAHFEEKAND